MLDLLRFLSVGLRLVMNAVYNRSCASASLSSFVNPARREGMVLARASLFPTGRSREAALIVLLAKYLSRRYVEIGDFRHIIVSGGYAFGLILLILVEPDMGHVIIVGTLWLGMMLVSGISKKHLVALGLIGLIVFSALWFGGLKPYQRERIISLLNPAADIHGSGYSAYRGRDSRWLG